MHSDVTSKGETMETWTGLQPSELMLYSQEDGLLVGNLTFAGRSRIDLARTCSASTIL